jgi:transcriptional regulator GlxA family with amidase domain
MLHRDTLTRLCQAREMLREAEERPASVREVAADLGMSQYHFIRLFKAVFGETPKHCQLRARLERAKHLLMLTDASVTDICMEVGFSSLGTFSTVFARRLGVAPSVYRRSAQSMVETPGQIPKQLIPGCFSLMAGPAG